MRWQCLQIQQVMDKWSHYQLEVKCRGAVECGRGPSCRLAWYWLPGSFMLSLFAVLVSHVEGSDS